MKKTTAILFAALLAIVPLSAQATAERPTISISSYDEWLAAGVQNGWVVDGNISEPEAISLEISADVERVEEKPADKIVIIDAYFDVSQITGNVSQICVADLGCSEKATRVSSSNASLIHGTEMAKIVRNNNSSAELLLVRAGSVRNGILYQASAREISKALSSVPSDSGVVSISIYNNGNSVCRPGTARAPGTPIVNVSLEVSNSSNAVSKLVESGINVIAAAGNGSRFSSTKIDFPACLPGATAVAKSSANGQALSQGGAHPELDALVYPSTGLVGNFNTTSGLTALLASKWSEVKSGYVPNSDQLFKLEAVN
jgi:hypothetical protein